MQVFHDIYVAPIAMPNLLPSVAADYGLGRLAAARGRQAELGPYQLAREGGWPLLCERQADADVCSNRSLPRSQLFDFNSLYDGQQ